MEANIFPIDNDSRHLREIFESMAETDAELFETGGELTPALAGIMAQDEHALARKVDGYGAVIRDFDAKLAAIDAETKRLAALKKFYSRAKDGLVNYLDFQMKRFGVTELRGETTRVTYRKSTAIEIDEDAILKPYLPLLEEMQAELPPFITIGAKVGKKEVATALDNGDAFPEGAAAKVERNNIQIK